MKAKTWTAVVPARARKRNIGGGRSPMSDCIGEELWHWFVDRINTARTRLGSRLLLAQANLYRGDLMQHYHTMCEVGRADPRKPPQLPQINENYIHRWRKAYGVTWRTVNLRYKVSHKKRLFRLGVFWRNVLRIRFYHAARYGPNKLRFSGFDQKPFYFNSSVAA